MRYLFLKDESNLNDFDKRIMEDLVLRNYFRNPDIDDFIDFLEKNEDKKIDMLFLSKYAYNSDNYLVKNPLLEAIKLCFNFSFSSDEPLLMEKQHRLLELCLSKITDDLFEDVNNREVNITVNLTVFKPDH